MNPTTGGPMDPAAVLLAAVAQLGIVNAGFKPGLAFNATDCPALATMKKTSDVVFGAPRCCRQHVQFTSADEEQTVQVSISVHTGDLAEARREFIKYALTTVMTRMWGLGPAGLGDFALVNGPDVPARKSDRTLYFLRSNIGVTINCTTDNFPVPDLARQIDDRIKALATVKDLAPLCPQGVRVTVSKPQVQVGETVEANAAYTSAKGETYRVFILSNSLVLEEESRTEKGRVWTALAPGVSPVKAVVCDAKLLSGTAETAVKVVDPP